MKTFSVKNFEKFQHYKDRAPPWIKLYNGLLEDYEFGLLPDASKMHLIAIWLLASRSDNKIPYDAKWVSGRINATETVDLELLAERGFIVLDQGVQHVASKPPAKCLSREEGQVQDIGKRKEDTPSPAKPQARANDDFENLKKSYPKRLGNYGWKAAERKFNSLVKTGVDPKIIIAAAVRLGAALRSRVGTEFIPMPASWLNSEDFLESAVVAFDEAAPVDWDAICDSYKRFGIWSKHAPGNAPDTSSCQCPPEILAKYEIYSNLSTTRNA